jgi:HEAT repeat protein
LAANQHKGPVAPDIVERFVKQLNVTFKAVKLYPLSSNIPRDNARVALEILHQILRRSPEVRFDVAKDGLFYESLPVYPGHPAFMAFSREFYNRGLAEVRFHAGTTMEELLRFLSVLDVPVPEIASSGGIEARLWNLGVNSISVKEVSARIVETADLDEDGEEEWPPPPRLIDDILAEALGRRPRAQRLLTRLIADGAALRAYLSSPSSPAEGSSSVVVSRRLASLARAAHVEDPAERQSLYRSLAGTLRTLDPELVREVLFHLLGDARHDETIASIVRAMALEDIASSLAAGLSCDERCREELSRTVRNLVALGIAPRQETVRAVDDAMAAAGVPDDFRSSVLEDASPSVLRIRERRHTEERPVDMVLRLLDIASNNVASGAQEAADTAELTEEAARGITDADVFGALVTIVSIEDRPEEFASVMSMLENNLGLLIERHDFEVAADAAESLVQAERREGLSEAQQRRIHGALTQLAQPDAMRTITSSMRLYRIDSAEHQACRRLLTILGENTVSALLEVLADEKDMANRKALVDMVSGMADRFIPELGARVSDPRWYFVRNVVSILSATRSPKALPYLERTLRHNDSRVRRETIRAISGIRDALSEEMMIAALADEDAGNVQVAARYLGSMKLRKAVPALQEVARGDGRGNRDVETRIDAIEALGRIGAPEAVPMLETMARQRSLRASRSRELRAAAQGALAAIKAGGGAA